MRQIITFLVLLLFVFFFGHANAETPSNVVIKFVEYIQNADYENAGKLLKEVGDNTYNPLDKLNRFVKACEQPPYRSNKHWLYRELKSKYLELFFPKDATISILFDRSVGTQADIEIKVVYPENSRFVFVSSFEYTDSKPIYSGIQPIFQDTHGYGRLGPYSLDDPKFLSPDDWHRRKIALKPEKVKSVKLTFRMKKNEKSGKWFIEQINSPYKDRSGDLNREYYELYELGPIESSDINELNEQQIEEIANKFLNQLIIVDKDKRYLANEFCIEPAKSKVISKLKENNNNEMIITGSITKSVIELTDTNTATITIDFGILNWNGKNYEDKCVITMKSINDVWFVYDYKSGFVLEW